MQLYPEFWLYSSTISMRYFVVKSRKYKVDLTIQWADWNKIFKLQILVCFLNNRNIFDCDYYTFGNI